MRIVALLFALLLLTTPASATPPQAVEVSETLLGVNDTHLFVLRRLDDNLGRYQPTQTDIVLIARNRQTNQDECTWPVMRMIDHGFDYATDNFETQVEPLPLENRINPFDILLSRNARLMLDQWPVIPMESEMDVHLENGMLTIISEDMAYRLSESSIANAFTQSLNATRKAVPPYFIEGGEKGIDPLLDVRLSPAQECKIYDFFTFPEVGEHGRINNIWIARVTCESEDAMSGLSMFLFLPQVQ